MSSRPLNNQGGFTLIEVMISLIIITFISLSIYQLTTETYRLRDVLSAEGEFYNGIRMSMDILNRDVMAMYSPILSLPQAQPSPNAQNPAGGFAPPPPPPDPDFLKVQASDSGQLTQFWRPAVDKSGLRPARFVGTDSKMTFISVSHTRIYKDAPESDLAKITYELVRDEDHPIVPDSMVLIKTESSDAFDGDDHRDERYQNKYPLLHGIKKFRYRYWRKDTSPTGKWETSWDSDKEEFRDKYPDMIEVTFDVNGPQKLSFSALYDFRPEVPLRGLDPSS